MSAFEFALRRILLELGTDDDWSVICAFSANHGVEAVHAAAREMLATLPLASSLANVRWRQPFRNL